MKAPEKEKLLEDVAVRVMYFFNTMDSYLIFTALLYYFCAMILRQRFSFLVVLDGCPAAVVFFIVFFYGLLKICDFYPTWLFFIPPGLLLCASRDPHFLHHLAMIAMVIFVYTSVIQIVLMGLPMSLAARKADIPFRMYLNSLLILSPTTMSMPLTVIYLVFIIYAAQSVAARPFDGSSPAIVALCVLAAFIVRRTMRKNIPLKAHHPDPPERPFSRLIVLNIDGLSHGAFRESRAPFLKALEKEFCAVEGGARTVFRALTNPAFVSILTGSNPGVHGVASNNVGQTIRVEALPDFIDTRLYGSMHVRHFSRKEWQVKVFSLVELGYQKADDSMMDELKKDIMADPSIPLRVVDLSQVDYAGHSWGSYSRRHYDAISRVDAIIRDFFQWMHASALLEDTLIIISADHGLFIVEHSFLISPREEFVPLMFIGRGIVPAPFPVPVSIMDICSHVSYFLGKRYCSHDCGRVFEEMFPGRESSEEFEGRIRSVLSDGAGEKGICREK